MTPREFITALEEAVREDDRWKIRQLNHTHKHSPNYRNACRHADNLVYSVITENRETEDISRTLLQKEIKTILAEKEGVS